MGENSKISWCTHTANFWIGCTEVSAECDNCYARTLAGRYGWAEWGNDKPRHQTKITVGKLKSWDKKAVEAGERHRVFVNSLSDVCDQFAPPAWRETIRDCAKATPNLDYLLLTKRPQNYSRMFELPPSNMWGGTTVGVRKSIARIDHLRNSDFRVKFLSIEPLLEDLGELDLSGINWVIIGGESGAGCRPLYVDWVRNVVRQAKEQGVFVFIKQMGANVWDRNDVGFEGDEPNGWPMDTRTDDWHLDPSRHYQGAETRVFLRDKGKGGNMSEFPLALQIREFPV